MIYGPVSVASSSSFTVGILKVEELAHLLEVSTGSTLPYWAIGAFAGLRAAELERVEWCDVHFESALIEVPAQKSKTAAKRFVQIQPALEAWLEPYKNRRGPICPVNLRKLLEADRKRAAILIWPNNALRHSFAFSMLCRKFLERTLGCAENRRQAGQ